MSKKRKTYTKEDPIYKFIIVYHQQNGFSPTVREISAACHLSSTATFNRLDNLEKDQLVARRPGRARTLVVL